MIQLPVIIKKFIMSDYMYDINFFFTYCILGLDENRQLE